MPARPGFLTAMSVTVAVVVVATVVVSALPPIPQDPAYHAFADGRPLLGVPNALNVLSNVAFVLVGVWGLAFTIRHRRPTPGGPLTDHWEATAFGVLFVAVGLTGAGSAWYHLAPTNGSLVWDRIPIAVITTTLLAITIADRVSIRAARWLWSPLVAFGVASVLVWWRGEQIEAGDLRLYALAQFAPVLTIPLMIALFPPRYSRGGDLVGAMLWYILAKLCEHLDAQIFALGQFVSGHTLKHLVAALAAWWVLRMLERRRPVAQLSLDSTCEWSRTPPPTARL